MLGLFALLATAAFGPADPAPLDLPPAIRPAAFQASFELAAEERLAIPDDVLARAARFRYVLVGGLNFGGTQGYLTHNARQLRARGVPAGAVEVIHPDSTRTIRENADDLRARIHAIAAKGPEKLVLIAHSRGACDVLAFALQDAAFVNDRVDAMFLVQGPFGGSGVADYAAGDGPEADGQMPLLPRIAVRAGRKIEATLADPGRHRAIAELSHESCSQLWAELIAGHGDALAVVSPRTFYITSRTTTAKHPALQRVTASYLHAYYGPNDGLVALEDQDIPGLGTVLAVLDAGHTDLTRRFLSARPRAKARLQKALADSILLAVGSPREALVETTFRRTVPAPPRGRR
ncbi:lipase family alpha/beta hydrolase [Aquisphaera insulae]|uniref:lipase family alpha/beta hydrolase n=1 Tax=Aquisphaera insulae TaxID=2712864 RepID=UPI0013EC4B20|nr:alpha/beta hydrolase [Aquisphaera insulae]